MTETNEMVQSRDLNPSMIPIHENYGEEDDSEEEASEEAGGDDDNTSILGGAGTPVTNLGITYYPQQAVAVQLSGLNVGR
jgi:hypothetical protein